jgi:predicted RecA/RadA family phage recombinase
MINMIGNGNYLDYTCTQAQNSGDLIFVGSLAGVAVSSGVIGQVISLAISGVFNIAKVSTDNITQGAPVYQVPGNPNTVTMEPPATPILVGWAYTAAAAGQTTVQVKFKGGE